MVGRVMSDRSPQSRFDVPADAARWTDALRAVLALVVAFSHAWILLVADHRAGDALVSYPFFFFAGFGHPAVMLFFVLSGFWIAKSVDRLEARGWSWSTFLVDRWSRIGIVVLPAIVIGGTIDAIGLWVVETPAHLGHSHLWFLPDDMARTLSPTTILGNFLFLQSIVVPPLGSNGPLWSVAFEFWYYLWFAGLWLAIRRRHFQWALLSFAVVWFSTDLAAGFLAWLMGAAAWHGRGRIAPRWWLPVGALLAGTLLWSRLGDWFAEDQILAAVAALFLVAVIARNPRFPRFLNPLATFGARSSFSLYATHFPIMTLIAGLAGGAGRMVPGPAAIALVTLVVVATMLWAIGFSKLTEARTASLRAWLGRRPRRPLPAK